MDKNSLSQNDECDERIEIALCDMQKLDLSMSQDFSTFLRVEETGIVHRVLIGQQRIELYDFQNENL